MNLRHRSNCDEGGETRILGIATTLISRLYSSTPHCSCHAASSDLSTKSILCGVHCRDVLETISHTRLPLVTSLAAALSRQDYHHGLSSRNIKRLHGQHQASSNNHRIVLRRNTSVYSRELAGRMECRIIHWMAT